MENKTAVEWLQEALEQTILTHEQEMQTIGLFEQAKAMEKDQIICARMNGMTDNELSYTNAEEYYNETYGKK